MSTLEALHDRVAGTISRYNMLCAGDRVGVAVSGGADSVCLLHVLHRLAPRFGVRLTVVHLNHKLRGEASDADAGFVSQLAASLGLEAVVESADVSAMPGNLEQAARNARLGLFRTLVSRGCVDRIATAHTRSDQAETVLYRMLRGSGTAGLSGIRPVTGDGLIRPMLDVDRAEVVKFLTDNGLEWRRDASNLDPRFVRNRIRRDLLPQLAHEYNPNISATLARTAEIAQDEEAWWAEEVRCIAATLPGFPDLRLSNFNALQAAVRRRVIRHALTAVRGSLRALDAGHIESVLRLTEGHRGSGKVTLPGGTEVVRSFDLVRIICNPAGEQAYELPVSLPDVVTLPDHSRQLCFQIIDIPSTLDHNALGSVYNRDGDRLDADRLAGPLIIRSWRAGDVLEREGRSARKLKSLFQRARIPVWERQSWPVLTCNARVAWTRQFGVAAGYGPTQETRRVVVVSEIEIGHC